MNVGDQVEHTSGLVGKVKLVGARWLHVQIDAGTHKIYRCWSADSVTLVTN